MVGLEQEQCTPPGPGPAAEAVVASGAGAAASSRGHRLTAARAARRRARPRRPGSAAGFAAAASGGEPEQVGAPGQAEGAVCGRPRGPAGAGGCARRHRRTACQLRIRPGETLLEAEVVGRGRRRPGPARSTPRARERCSSAKAVRVVIRPTVRAGTWVAQTVSRWRPLSRRDFRMARPGAGRHALAEAVGLGPLPGVGLVSALHVNQPFATTGGIRRPVRRRVHAAAFGSSPGRRRRVLLMLGAIWGPASSRIVVPRCTFDQLPAPRIVPNAVARTPRGEKGRSE